MTAEGSRRSKVFRNSTVILLVHFGIVIGLLTYHVNAEYVTVDSCDRSLLERLSLGPDYFTTMDKVLFAIIIVLAMELLNFIAHNSGGKRKRSRSEA